MYLVSVFTKLKSQQTIFVLHGEKLKVTWSKLTKVVLMLHKLSKHV